MQKNILIVRSTGLLETCIEKIRKIAPDVFFRIVDGSLSSIVSQISGIHALIGCPRSNFSVDLLDRAGPTLEWVHIGGAGCEEFIIPELHERNIVLTNGRIIQGPEVADHALGLLLCLTRRMQYVLRDDVVRMPRPIELRGKTALVVGLGGIGTLVAERLHAFGMKVLGVDAEYKPLLRAIDEWFLPAALHDALPRADAVVLCTPVTRETHTLIGRDEFAVMKTSVYIVNVCRGVVVDTAALTQALFTGSIFAAGLDVTDPEPLPAAHPLRHMPNVVITPHCAGQSDQNRERGVSLLQENVRRFAFGEPLINIVNTKLGY